LAQLRTRWKNVSAYRRVGTCGAVGLHSRATGVARLETSFADHAANKGQVKRGHGEVAKGGTGQILGNYARTAGDANSSTNSHDQGLHGGFLSARVLEFLSSH
jgi:hypothetical protein